MSAAPDLTDPLPPPRSEFRLSLSTARMMLWILGGIGGLLALFGLWTMTQEGAVALAMVVPGLFLVWMGWFFHARARKDRAPRLIIDRDGIRCPRQTQVPIPWANIEKLVLAETHGNRQAFLAIDVDDVPRFATKRSGRALSRLNRLYGGGEIIVPVHELDAEISEIEAAIRHARPEVPLQLR